jgi:hypothetical protein
LNKETTMALTLSEQLRGSRALHVLESNREWAWGLQGAEVDAIEDLMEIVRRQAEPDGAAPASTSANGPEQSGVGAASYREI